MAGVAPAGAVDDALPGPPADPMLVSRTAGVVLARVDSGVQAAITRKVRALGGDDKLAGEMVAQAALPQDTKELLSQLAPLAVEAAGGNARNFPMIAFGVAMVGWIVGIVMVFMSLRQLAADQKKILGAAPAAAAAEKTFAA